MTRSTGRCFVGKIIAAPGEEKRASVSDRQMASKELYAPMGINTAKVKICNQCGILATASDSMIEEDRQSYPEFSRSPQNGGISTSRNGEVGRDFSRKRDGIS